MPIYIGNLEVTPNDNIDKIYAGNNLIWESTPTEPAFYVQVAAAGNVCLNAVTGATMTNGMYKVDDGSWASYTLGQNIALTPGQKCYFKADSYCHGTELAPGVSNNISAIGGNIQSLNNYSTTITSTACYAYMFAGCTSLASISAGLLPATILNVHCYAAMFYSCIALTSIPANLLPATTLAAACYQGMFSDCSSLTSIPANLLPATTLAQSCYCEMFGGCTSLVTLPKLLVTTLVDSCYKWMFNGCTSIKLSTTSGGEYINEYRIPYGTATGTYASNALETMFLNTGGTWTGTPNINIPYYTSNTVI